MRVIAMIFDEMEREFREARSVEELRSLLHKYCINYITCAYAEILYAERKRALMDNVEVR